MLAQNYVKLNPDAGAMRNAGHPDPQHVRPRTVMET